MKARLWLLPLQLLAFALTAATWAQPPDMLIERARKYEQSEPDSALVLLRRALKVIDEKREPECLIDAYAAFGRVYFYHSDFDSSFKYLQAGLRAARRHGYERAECSMTAMLGLAFKNKGEYVEAARNLKSAIKQARSRGDSLSLGAALINLANIYLELEAYEKGRPFLEEAQLINERRKDSSNLAVIHFYLGNIALKDEPRAAVRHFEQAFDISLNHGDNLRAGEAQWGMGRAFHALKSYQEAKRRFHAALWRMEPYPFQTHFISSAWIDLMFVHQATNGHDSAAYYAGLLTQVVDKIAHAETRMRSCRDLATYYSAAGQNEKASYYYRAYVAASDSVLYDRHSAYAQILDMSSEEIQQELQGELTKQELAQQKERRVAHGIGTLALIALLVVSFAVIIRIRFLKKRLRRAYRQEVRLSADLQASNDRLREALTQIKEANRLRDLLTSAIVHDLKNPLNSIIGLAQLPLSEQTRLMIQRSGKKMLGQVHDLLDLQRLEQAKLELKIENCPALLVLQDALAEVEYEARARGVRLEAVSPQDLIAPCDENLIHRVLVNLLTNALKFSPREAAVQAGAERGGKFLHFWVADQGPGVPEHLREMIFERFTQAEAASQTTARSSGLGLAFCKLAVEAHGGRILVERGVLGGACFSFYLPSVPQERPARTERTETGA